MPERNLYDHIDSMRDEVMGEIRSLRTTVMESLERIAVIESRCQERCALANKNGNGITKLWPLIWRVSLLAAGLVAAGLGGYEGLSRLLPKLLGGSG